MEKSVRAHEPPGRGEGGRSKEKHVVGVRVRPGAHTWPSGPWYVCLLLLDPEALPLSSAAFRRWEKKCFLFRTS